MLLFLTHVSSSAKHCSALVEGGRPPVHRWEEQKHNTLHTLSTQLGDHLRFSQEENGCFPVEH